MFLTTWGERFLHRLIEKEAQRKAGAKIDRYAQACIESGRDLRARLEEFRSGRFVHFAWDFAHYGETFLSRTVVEAILQAEKIPLKLLDVNEETLAQDALVLEKV